MKKKVAMLPLSPFPLSLLSLPGNPDGLHKLKEQESPHLIAGLVMWHLKRQSEPLVPYSLYPLVVAAGAGAAAAAEAAARRARFPDEDAQEDEVDDDVDDDERDDVDDEEDVIDEEADRGGGRGAGVEVGVGEEGGARDVGGGGGAAVAKALAAVASVAKKGGFLTGEKRGLNPVMSYF